MPIPDSARRSTPLEPASDGEHASRRAAWDERHAAASPIEAPDPSPHLVAEATGLQAGRALDLATGDGTNAIWLARQGWEVTAVDFSAVGLARARRQAAAQGVVVDWVLADLLEYEPPQRAFDLLTIFFLHLPSEERAVIYGRAAGAVAPGGSLLVVGHDRTNLTRGAGGPQDPAVLFTPEEIAAELPGLEVVRAARVARATPSGRDAIDAVVRAVRPG